MFVFVRGPKRSRWIFPGLRDISGYRAMFADFLGALGGGSGSGMTLPRARRDLELVEAAARTAEQIHPVDPLTSSWSRR